MPSKAKIRTGLAETSRDGEYKLKTEKESRQHHGSKTIQEKAPSPKASQRLKLKDNVRTANPVHYSHADQLIEFVKDVNKGIYVSSKAADHQQQQHVKRTASNEGEVVMCMSKLPSYLKTGENVQTKDLSYGVIDWVHLENWKQKRISGRDDKTTSFERRSNSSKTRSSSSQSNSSNKIDFQVGQPPNGEATDHSQHSNKQGLTCRQPELYGAALGKLPPKVGDKGSYQKSKLGPRTSSHPGNQVSPSSNGNIPNSPQEERTANGKGLESHSACQHFPSNQVSSSSKESSPDLISQREERTAKGKGLESHSACQQTPCKNDNIILLLPKDISIPSSSEISRGTSFDGVSSEFSWNSFSDVFSTEDVQSEISFSDISHFSPLESTAECESQVDLKLDNLINAQGVELESDLPCLSPKLDRILAAKSMIKDAENKSEKNISFPGAPKGLEQEADGSVNAENSNSSASRPMSFGRLARSLSFREDAAVPQTSSTYVSAKSGPVRAEFSVSFGCSDSNRANPDGRCSDSPLRRFFSPLLKHRPGKPVSSSQSIQACPENPDNFSIRPGSALEALFNEKSRATTTKAHLHVTVKGGLPLFKFLVETNNDILASTVKKLTPFEKDGPNWLYTFYSVHKVARKNGSWKNLVNKHKNTELSYTVAGQMKVYDPHFLVEGQVMKQASMESVLYKTEESTSKFTASEELAAIVVKMNTESLSTKNNNRNGNLSSGWFDNAEENENTGSIVAILPSGMHGLPSGGIPSPLISRWRSGGLCACGGWDIGCRLRVLTNEAPDDKSLRASRACSMHDRLDLFIQGTAKQLRPTFRSVSQGNGLFSVEYDAAISSLQAFAICVAFVNRQKVTGSLHQKRHNESGQKHERSNS